MQKLCHVLSIERQVKTNSGERLTGVYQQIQKEAALNGISRTYEPISEDGEKFPPETQLVQLRLTQALKEIVDATSPLYDTVATRDLANCHARADVVVNGITVLKGVPAVTLLYLEKQLVDLHTVICKLAELPPTEDWKFDANSDCYKSEAVRTAKTKKITKPFVKYPHTEQHPAQVDVVSEDIVTGYWTTVKYSGALRREDKRKLRERIELLLAATKMARETANQAEAPPVSVAKEVFGFLMAT